VRINTATGGIVPLELLEVDDAWLSRGGSVVQAAAKLDAKKLAAQCRSELEAFKQRAGRNSFDVAPESMCSSVADIQKSLREVAEWVKEGNDCDGV